MQKILIWLISVEAVKIPLMNTFALALGVMLSFAGSAKAADKALAN